MDGMSFADSRLDSVLFSREAIRERVHAMAADILRDFGDSRQEPLLVVGILKGACPFQMDMSQALAEVGLTHQRWGFLRVSSYGDGMESLGESGRKIAVQYVGMPAKSSRILLLDDVFDQGYTLAAVQEEMLRHYPGAALRTAVMLEKNAEGDGAGRRMRPDYVGFEAPQRWVVGYGMDIGEEFRELPCIATVHEECFRHE